MIDCRSLLSLTVAAAALVPLAAVHAQPAPVAKPAAPQTTSAKSRATPEAPVPGNPDFAPDDAQNNDAPPPLPPVVWDPVSAQDLVYYIRQIGVHGLDPSFYDPDGLEAAIRSGNPAVMSAEATARFNAVSSDLALGHVRKKARIDWHIVDKDLDSAAQDALLRRTLAGGRIADALNGLQPTHPQYEALKAALQVTPASETAKRDRIMLNMDRWRWLPKDLGQKYIIVNVPGFHATLVEDGQNRWKERAIAGKITTPTPQLAAVATGVILNPWWEVPKSIEGEVRGKKGYVPLKGKDGKIQRWRQPPGPSNALGEMKFVMPNSKAIYLHDTNARSRFNSDVRALSHGCIRTQHIHDLAATLGSDDGGEWTRERIDSVLASDKTVQANFVKPVPVYIVYFSAAALLDGKIVDYKDLYKRDTAALKALKSKSGV